METPLCALEVRVHGRSAREYYHDRQIWIEGRKGSDFTLRLSNRTHDQILMVPSIDGLSVMDGKEASFDDRGYIIPARGYVDVPGWRLNDNEVAKFCFHKSANSYAAQSNKPQNIGVIGCAVFQAKLRWTLTTAPSGPPNRCRVFRSQSMDFGPVYGTTYSTAGPMSRDSVFVGACQEVQPSLGTEFGNREDHRVTSALFEKATNVPAEVLTIRYGDRDELRRRGVDLAQKPVVAGEPSPFPAEQGCQPPPNWKGG